jgi:FtsP/CotA-like multicopper oxidase with cupredoxin domain
MRGNGNREGLTGWSPHPNGSLGKRYRISMRNVTSDVHPIHLHLHNFEITHVARTPTAGVYKTSRCWAASMWGLLVAVKQ